MRVMPRQPVPSLEFDTLEHGRWSLAAQTPQHFTMIVFYRGLHCPVCRKYTSELNGMIGEFDKRGVSTVIASNDSAERAREARDNWGLQNLVVGYGMPIESSRQWGLYVSTGRGKTSVGVEEPPLFAEPGLFFVRPDGTLYWSSVQTMPFARPHFPEIVAALDIVLARNYPARGEA
jgi:peroxiredoxin